ncbi:MAG: XdhC family protein [Stellaceae bacterium]
MTKPERSSDEPAPEAGPRDILGLMLSLRDRRQPFALATVVETAGSVSAKTGGKALIGADGRVLAGWVGGGCAEASVCHAALDAMKSGETTIIGLDLDDEVLGTGMPCGGSMRVYVEPVLPKPRLWILGHGQVAESLCAIGAIMDLEVVVDDPMADRARYPAASLLLTDDVMYDALAPGPDDYVVIATQHKGDHESMKRCLGSPVRYIALIASRKRSKLVLDYVRKEGFGEDELARIYAPAGLDFHARTPGEIALSTLGEIVMLRRGGTGAHRREAIRAKEPRRMVEAPA